MRILLSTYGSRGDVEPMAGLGAQLQALGAEVVVCAPPDEEFAALLARAGVKLAPAFSSVRQWVTEALANRAAVDLPALAAKVLAGQLDAIALAAEGCDVILAAGLFSSTAAAKSVADQWALATSMPLSARSGCHRRITGRMSIPAIRCRRR